MAGRLDWIPFRLVEGTSRRLFCGLERKTTPSTWRQPRRERAWVQQGAWTWASPVGAEVVFYKWTHLSEGLYFSWLCYLPTVTPGDHDRAKSLEPRPPCTFFCNPTAPPPPNKKHITKPGNIQARKNCTSLKK